MLPSGLLLLACSREFFHDALKKNMHTLYFKQGTDEYTAGQKKNISRTIYSIFKNFFV